MIIQACELRACKDRRYAVQVSHRIEDMTTCERCFGRSSAQRKIRSIYEHKYDRDGSTKEIHVRVSITIE